LNNLKNRGFSKVHKTLRKNGFFIIVVHMFLEKGPLNGHKHGIVYKKR
jgi:hypothetical protein